MQMKSENSSAASSYSYLEEKMQNNVALRYLIFVMAKFERLLAGDHLDCISEVDGVGSVL